MTHPGLAVLQAVQCPHYHQQHSGRQLLPRGEMFQVLSGAGFAPSRGTRCITPYGRRTRLGAVGQSLPLVTRPHRGRGTQVVCAAGGGGTLDMAATTAAPLPRFRSHFGAYSSQGTDPSASMRIRVASQRRNWPKRTHSIGIMFAFQQPPR